jgi:hypothetical protein
MSLNNSPSFRVDVGSTDDVKVHCGLAGSVKFEPCQLNAERVSPLASPLGPYRSLQTPC